MKKILLLFVVVLLLVGCGGGSQVGDEDVVEIRERLFIAQVNDIRINADAYVGRVLRYEGLFQSFVWPGTGQTYYQVIRYAADDCCGVDGIVGFEVYLGNVAPLPDNSWVEVTGVLEWFEAGGEAFLRVAIVSLTELAERGAETVSM